MCEIIEYSNCTFCDNHEETIDHLLYECQHVLRFWLDIARMLPSELNFTLTKRNIIIGSTHMLNLLNHVCILGKRYIYVTRCLKQHLNVTSFINKLKQVYLVEKTAAFLNNKSTIFDLKWSPLKNLLEPSSK